MRYLNLSGRCVNLLLTKGLYARFGRLKRVLQYLEKSQKLYDRRSEIIHGTNKATKEEIEEGEKENIVRPRARGVCEAG